MTGNLREQGFRFVFRDGAFNWQHPLELRDGDVDVTDLDDDQFEQFVILNAS